MATPRGQLKLGFQKVTFGFMDLWNRPIYCFCGPKIDIWGVEEFTKLWSTTCETGPKRKNQSLN